MTAAQKIAYLSDKFTADAIGCSHPDPGAYAEARISTEYPHLIREADRNAALAKRLDHRPEY